MFEIMEREISNPEWFLKEILEDIRPVSPNTQGYTLVHFCIASGYFDLLEFLIEKYNFDVDFYEPYAKNTLLHVWAR
jgi:hypothetical protein